MNERTRRAKEEMGWEARSQYRGEPLTGPLEVRVNLWWPDRRKHDVDNIKALLDALTGIVWEDDGQIEDLRVRKGFDKKRPRVEIEVGPLYESAAEGERVSFSV
jgi:crossover junction endodeoxyribonuclease RusA